MADSTDFKQIIAAAWEEAIRRGINLNTRKGVEAIGEIAIAMLDAQAGAPTTGNCLQPLDEKTRRRLEEDYVGVIWPDKRAVYYLKAAGPPAGVAEAVARGEARVVERKAAVPGASPTTDEKSSEKAPRARNQAGRTAKKAPVSTRPTRGN